MSAGFPRCLVVLSVVYFLVAALDYPARAAWAAHIILDTANRLTTQPISVILSDDSSRVSVFVPVPTDDKDMGFFIVRAKERLARKDLEFRRAMRTWKTYQEMAPLKEDYLKDSWKRPFWESVNAVAGHLEEIRHLQPETRDGVRGIFHDLSVEESRRTYVVYDYLPAGGSHVMDGGWWYTYDLPSFVDEVLGIKPSQGKSASIVAGADRFEIRNVLVQDGADGSKTFRVPIAKISKGKPDGTKLGVKLRVWERTPSGSLVLAASGVSIEWDLWPIDWNEGGVEHLVLTWTGPEPASGNTYYGFSGDVIYENRRQHSWATSPDLLKHPRAVEPLDVNGLKYGISPEYQHNMAWKLIQEVNNRRAAVTAGDIEVIKSQIEKLEGLKVKYPQWEPLQVERLLNEGRALLKSPESKAPSDSPVP